MKAMTWLKAGGCVLVALAAIAAADTRYAEVTGKGPAQGISHAIASRANSCPVSHESQQDHHGCCKKDAKEADESGCCRK
jgi:hypothetical protein